MQTMICFLSGCKPCCVDDTLLESPCYLDRSHDSALSARSTQSALPWLKFQPFGNGTQSEHPSILKASGLTKPRQIFLPLCLSAIVPDGIHDKGGLDAHGRAITGVHTLNLPGNQAICNRRDTRAPIARNCRSQQTKFTHLSQNFFMENWEMGKKNRSSFLVSISDNLLKNWNCHLHFYLPSGFLASTCPGNTNDRYLG